MAIYNRWGEIKIVAVCGVHHPDYLNAPDILLRVRWADSLENEKEFYVWAGFLKADNGWPEIKSAIDSDENVTLTLGQSLLLRAFERAR